MNEVRAVGAEAFEEIYPLLRLFPTTQMSKDDWHRMLFSTSWSDNPQRGYALYSGGKPVGFIATIFSKRELAGRLEPICSLSSWIMLPEHRDGVLALLTPILKLRDHTILNPTPSPTAYEIFFKLGFKPLESERFIAPPLPGPGEARRSLRGSFSRSRADLDLELTGDERKLYQDHSSCAAAQHVLLRHGERRCYVVATPIHKKGLPFAEIQYASDWDLFWEHRLLAHAALLPATRAMALLVDKRYSVGRKTPLGMNWPSRRLYRPTRKEIEPRMIDNLYSELMNLRW
ncbi:MAG: hypothetical protein E6J58_23095 [Deltaproteobacteria bacterium]|nr:MAG: hypothetical protein E6J58_23095 [Deltaproteobacteria bacterium]